VDGKGAWRGSPQAFGKRRFAAAADIKTVEPCAMIHAAVTTRMRERAAVYDNE
jgi:hypothetical protein